MSVIFYLSNYLRINFDNLLGGVVLQFNHGLISHHQLVMILINIYQLTMTHQTIIKL
jgi:hypothetical protein